MNINQPLLLQRLTLLRVAIAGLWCIFLLVLSLNHFANIGFAWLLLITYVPLLGISLWQNKTGRIQDWQLLLHLAFDCQLLAALLAITGGASNPLISCYLLLLVFAAYSLPLRYALLITFIALVDYTALTQWYLPLLSHEPHGLTSSSLFSLHLAGMWLTFVLSAIIFVTLIPLLVKATRQQQFEIQALREQQLKNEQLIGIATLAAGTAHEMGTPLMTMQMLVDELEHDINQPLQAEDLSILKQQIQHCRQSLSQLVEAGRHAQQEGQHNAMPWLLSLLEKWRLSHPQAQWQLDGSNCVDAVIPASPLLNQALLNLLNNAAEAGQEPINLSTQINNNFWQLSIQQNDSNAAESLTQSALLNSSKEHGMGLGLYLSNASIEQFGGSIHLRALENGGSLCVLQLPIVKAKPETKNQRDSV